MDYPRTFLLMVAGIVEFQLQEKAMNRELSVDEKRGAGDSA
jgi:hypothetical protein